MIEFEGDFLSLQAKLRNMPLKILRFLPFSREKKYTIIRTYASRALFDWFDKTLDTPDSARVLWKSEVSEHT